MADEPTKLIRKIAAEAYDTLAAAGSPFGLDTITAMVAADPAVATLGGSLVAIASRAAVRYVDERRGIQPLQQEMFADLDRVIAVGAGMRRRKGSCTGDDMAEHMRIVNENAAMVAASAARDQLEYVKLLPYLSAGMTVDEAVAAMGGES